jgi:Tol biopolymer transport system component/DNA-binding winged helix-turn-helix (wHTH) protein
MSQSDNKLYEFGAFRLDAAERVLWRGEEMLVLPPKVFDTLLMLVKREGRVVSKSELMEAIWADAFVEESNLSQNIYTLRRTLGVDEQGGQFIETVPRRGYRFAAPVKALSADEAIADNEAQTKEVFFNDAETDLPTEITEPKLNSSPSLAPTTNDRQTPETTQTLIAVSSVKNAGPRSAIRYALFAGLGALIFFALGFGIYQFVFRNSGNVKSKTALIEQIRFQSLTDIGDVVFATISPDGELLAYVRQGEQGESLWVKQIATGSSSQTLPPSREGYRSLAFSPDGRYLFFREVTNPGAIYQISSFFGSAPKKVADNVWSNFSVSPDGKQLAFIRRDLKRNAYLLILSNIDGSGERELSARNDTPPVYRHAFGWSPDGAKILVATSAAKLVTIDVSTGQETELKTPAWRAIFRALWMPSGKHLVVSARTPDEPYPQVWMIDYPNGEVRRLTNDLEAYFSVSLSSDGRMLVALQQRTTSRIWLLPDGDIKNAKQLTFGGRKLDGYGGLAWTPDGRIVFSHFADADNITDLYTINQDGSNRVQLTVNAGRDNAYPTVSRDGRYIVFTSSRTGKRQIWRMDIDGRNQKQLTFDEKGGGADFAALSPDGREVFFIKRGSNPSSIWKVSIDGGTPIQVSRLTNATAEAYLSISPDGKWLAYHHISDKSEDREEEQTVKIGALPTDGNAEPKLFDLPIRRRVIQWSTDSAGFYYISGTISSSSFWRQPLDGGKPQKLIELPDRIFNFAWSRDGKDLIVSRGKQQGDALLITNLPE